jgi:hypothetical protein
MDKIEKEQNVSDRSKPTNHSLRVGSKILILCILLVALAGYTYGIYTWQHHQVNTKAALVNNLTKEQVQLEKSNANLSKQVDQLNQKLQSTLSTESNSTPSTSSTTSSVSTRSTSKLIINSVEQIPASDYYSGAKSTDTYEEVTFTIHNNSSSTQTYYLDLQNYVKGITSNGDL